MDQIEIWIEQLLVAIGVTADAAVYLRLLILCLLIIPLAGISFVLSKKIIINYIYRLFKKSPIKWDDVLVDYKVLNNLAHIVPAVLVRVVAPIVFRDFESILPLVIKLTDIYLMIASFTIVLAILKIAELGLSKHPAFRDKPLMSYFQLVRIILFIVIFILTLSVLLNKSPIYFLSAFGAMTAIILLIFKDTILGLVASVQISSNDMVRVGDWVEMPKFNADGDVVAINLNTVKVRNWDKTITTIPTYYFITDSFKNWRGMVEAGGRRIKRSILINTQTVKFIDPETREDYKKYHLVSQYIDERQKEIEASNSDNNIDVSVLINGRRMTNLGVFRKYIESYLKNNPNIRQDMTILVRQLAIEERGVPIEIYCFTNTTAWVAYEAMQADVFDHLLAAAVYFELEIFQQPTGKDISASIDKFINTVNVKRFPE